MGLARWSLRSGARARPTALWQVHDRSAQLSFFAILTRLAEGAMDGEPDRIILEIDSVMPSHRSEALGAVRSSSFAWVLMSVFGISVVLLLLNLLIARFAKTFDMVYENVDANFKVP